VGALHLPNIAVLNTYLKMNKDKRITLMAVIGTLESLNGMIKHELKLNEAVSALEDVINNLKDTLDNCKGQKHNQA